jgi:hypothetical protein
MKTLSEVKHVSSLSNSYTGKATTVSYEVHKGVSRTLEFKDEAMAALHETIITHCEKYRKELEGEAELPSTFAVLKVLTAPSKDNTTATSVDFEEENPF